MLILLEQLLSSGGTKDLIQKQSASVAMIVDQNLVHVGNVLTFLHKFRAVGLLLLVDEWKELQ